MMQFSHLYMTTGKTIALTRQTFVGKVLSLFFNMLTRLVISEKVMATHSSVLPWKIAWIEEPGRLQSMGSLRAGHDFTFTFIFYFQALEKEMATHSSVLA